MSERKEKFTPGPWRVTRGLAGEHGYDCNEIVGPNGVGGCAIWLAKVQTVTPRADCCDLTQPPWATERLRDECESNAHIIAAAPELYEALEAFFASSWAALGDAYGETFSVSDEDRSDWAMAVRAFCRDADLARAALAKARGEE